MEDNGSGQNLFTCLSCAIAFFSAEDQRVHYRSDHHRYNMKRRVAGLAPVSAEIFTQKVLDRQAETAIMTSPKGLSCAPCGKSYTTEGAYRSHLSSKKHKENEIKAAKKAAEPKQDVLTELPSASTSAQEPEKEHPAPAAGVSLLVDAEATEEDVERTIDEKIAAARARLSSAQCLFCPTTSLTLDENLVHMSTAHSFFIPDTDYLDNLTGLLTYLGEKIAVGNVCIYCDAEFRTLDAVRRHMLDKGHCKIAYDTDLQRLEVSDFYDFTTSYPDAEKRAAKIAERKRREEEGEVEEWEDMSDDGEEADEVVEISEDDDSEIDPEEYNARLGDTPYELILPSGTKVSHRHVQGHHRTSHLVTLRRTRPGEEASAVAELRKALGEKNSSLVPTKGGFGAFGSGMQLIKARNAGEAREAGRHVREFRDMNRREQFKTKVGFRHNSQKHFRDPLLQ
ncbi:hypothetical protein QCA50_004311 [Cerrena zonata]|uniref:C2H2-type domain-containing protein n=1 Tax=Cerrena zonata TaxID=2478898 RepID=A0AAW0GGW9_9APHY